MRFIISLITIVCVNAFNPLSYLVQLERQTKESYIKNNMGLLPIQCNMSVIQSTNRRRTFTGKDLDKFLW